MLPPFYLEDGCNVFPWNVSGLWSTGLWNYVVLQTDTDILEKHAVAIFREDGGNVQQNISIHLWHYMVL
jgi:hypothetical protein